MPVCVRIPKGVGEKNRTQGRIQNNHASIAYGPYLLEVGGRSSHTVRVLSYEKRYLHLHATGNQTYTSFAAPFVGGRFGLIRPRPRRYLREQKTRRLRVWAAGDGTLGEDRDIYARYSSERRQVNPLTLFILASPFFK